MDVIIIFTSHVILALSPKANGVFRGRWDLGETKVEELDVTILLS